MQTGISNSYWFGIYTIYANLTYLAFDFGDGTYETFNITGKKSVSVVSLSSISNLSSINKSLINRKFKKCGMFMLLWFYQTYSYRCAD